MDTPNDHEDRPDAVGEEGAEAVEEAESTGKRMPARTKVLVGLLGLLILAWVAHGIDTSLLNRELLRQAPDRIEEFRTEFEGEHDIATGAVVSRQNVLMGAPTGTLSLYALPKAPSSDGKVIVFDFLYTRQDREWTLDRGNRDYGEEARKRGRKALGL